MNMDFMKQTFKQLSKGAVNQSNINIKELNSLKIIIPPISLQTQFANFVKEVDKSKLAIQKSLDKLEILKKSLMQKYFG